MKENTISSDHSSLWKLVGKTIATNPAGVENLLRQHNLLVNQKADSDTLVNGIMNGLNVNNARFKNDLTELLSGKDEYDNFINAIAGAVSSVANVVGGAQKNKAIKLQAKATREQAKSQTLQSLLAYKAQQEQNKMEKQKLDQGLKKSSKESQLKTWLLIGGVAVALVIVGLVVRQQANKTALNQIIEPIK